MTSPVLQIALEALRLTISAQIAPDEWQLDVFETAIEKCRVVLPLLEAAIQQQPEPVAPNPLRDEAYDQIDRFLRNNLDDADYADYSQALDLIYTETSLQQQEVPSMNERIAAALECLEDNDNHGATVILKAALASPSPTEQQEGARDSGGVDAPGGGKQ